MKNILESINNLILEIENTRKYEDYKKYLYNTMDKDPNWLGYQLKNNEVFSKLNDNESIHNNHYPIVKAGSKYIVIKDNKFYKYNSKTNKYIHLGDNPDEFHKKVNSRLL
jgi:hypothetical protein